MNPISLEERNVIHSHIIASSRKEGFLMLAAALITLFAVAVIIVTIVCFVSFTNVNIVNQLVLPVTLPFCLAFVCIAVPIFGYVYKIHKTTKSKLNSLNHSHFDMLKDFYNNSLFAKPDKNRIADFLETGVLAIQANRFYKIEILEALKSLFPKKKLRNEDDNNMILGIDRTIENIKLTQNQRKKRDEQEKKEEKKVKKK